jgi:cytochrome c553
MNKKILFFTAILIFSGLIIISYLLSSGTDFYTIFSDNLSSAGASLYRDNCAKCHGAEGEGVASYPVIRNSKRTNQEIKQLIVHGSGEMPAFAKFTETELDQLVDYILEL